MPTTKHNKIFFTALSTLLFISIAQGACIVKANISAPEVTYDIWDEESIHLPYITNGRMQENSTLNILSPLSNEVLSQDVVTLKVNIGTQKWAINSVYYEADWQEGVHRIYSVNNHTSAKMLYRLSVTANFTGIADGRHSITVYANLHDGSHVASSVDFTVNAPPLISILLTENKTYPASLALNFTANEPISWACYSLDGKTNVTISGNNTIGNLAGGVHCITVYALDASGNIGASQPTNFAVAASTLTEAERNLNQILPAACAIAVIIGISVGLLIYFKRRSPFSASILCRQ